MEKKKKWNLTWKAYLDEELKEVWIRYVDDFWDVITCDEKKKNILLDI